MNGISASVSNRIAFFDVDKTLLDLNTASLWLRREVQLGHLSRVAAVRGGFWLALYALGFAPMESLIADGVKTLQDHPEPAVAARMSRFFLESVRPLIRPRAVAAIAAHRARGDRVYLLTSATNHLSALLTKELELDGHLCNQLEVADGRFTGRVVPPICYGAGKVTHALALVKALGATLKDSVFYTDSFSDVAMLDAVGMPVVVTPDIRLRRYAKKRGWPIEDWSLASSASTP